MRWWLVAIATMGCGFRHGAVASGDGSVASDTATAIDSQVDAQIDAFDPLCFGPDPFVVCLPAVPTTPLTIDGMNVITNASATAGKCADDTGDIVTIGGASVCAISATTLTLGVVDAGGALPLVFVATETVTVTGDIAANSANSGNSGPGANSAMCGDMSMTSGTDGTNGAGGGAGGSFGGRGGNGGNGVTAAPGGDGALAVALDSPAAGGVVNAQGATAGGDGGYMALALGAPGQSTAGGAGGGGGGVGVIRVMYGQSIPAANSLQRPSDGVRFSMRLRAAARLVTA